MNLLLAIILGTAFGYVLYSIGAGDGDVLINMLRLRVANLMKTILLGIGIAAVLLFVANSFGVINAAHFDIKPLHMGVIIGGAIFGIGWGVSGYCPGTSIAAIGAGKKDAWFYIIGGLVGAILFTLTYSNLKAMNLFEPLLGGSVTLFEVTPDIQSLLSLGNIGGVIVGGVFIIIAFLIPYKIIKQD